MPRRRASKIRRAIQAAEYEQIHILRQEANAQRWVGIQLQAIPRQVAEPQDEQLQVAEPQDEQRQVAKYQVAEHQVPEIKVAKPQTIPERVYNWIQDLYRKITPQLLPPIEILIQQATGNFQDQNVIQPETSQQALLDEDELFQLMHVDEA